MTGRRRSSTDGKEARGQKRRRKSPARRGGDYSNAFAAADPDVIQAERVPDRPNALAQGVGGDGEATAISWGRATAPACCSSPCRRTAPNAWEVQRELEANFPDTRLGLNYVYRPTSPTVARRSLKCCRSGTARKGCSAELCYGPKLIDWDKKPGRVRRGPEGRHDRYLGGQDASGFPPKGPEDVRPGAQAGRAARAPLAWHGVLSVMAGLRTAARRV